MPKWADGVTLPAWCSAVQYLPVLKLLRYPPLTSTDLESYTPDATPWGSRELQRNLTILLPLVLYYPRCVRRGGGVHAAGELCRRKVAAFL